MRIRDKRFYTYPVLGSMFNSYKNSNFLSDVNETIFGNDISLIFEAKTDNSTLNELIINREAEFVHHIECSKTCFRKALTTNEEVIEYHININEIDDKIIINSFIIAAKDLERYSNVDFSDDYSGFSFNIPKGGVLAIGNEIIIDVNKNNNELGAQKSIFQIVSDKDCSDKKLLKIDLNKDLIMIKIPEKEFVIYDALQKQNKTMIYYHAMVILPVLVSILFRIQNGDEIDDFSDQRWYKVLCAKFAESGKEISSKEYDPFEEAQKILNYPITHSINLMIENTGDADEN